MTLGNALLRLADERGQLALSSSGKAKSCFLTGAHGGKKIINTNKLIKDDNEDSSLEL